MKKTIKLLVIILIMLQILFATTSVFALDKVNVGDSVLLYSTKALDDIKMNYYGQDILAYYTVYKKDGIEYPAYCVDYFKGGVTDTRQYNVQITEEYVDENYTDNDSNKIGVWKAIVNGYPFKTYEELECLDNFEAYAATKQAVFCMLYNRDLSLYTYEGEAGKRVYDAMTKIVETARNSTKVPTSTNINMSETEWQIDEANNKVLSKKITLNCETKISKFNVTLEGDVPRGTILTDLQNRELTEFKNCTEFKVLVPLESLTESGEFTINVTSQANSYPMFFGESEISTLQSYVLTAGIAKQELSGIAVEYPENRTKLVINKHDEDNNILPGVKFNILDENKNVIYENLITDEEGNIEIKSFIPGTYYLQETETLEGYELNKELIEFSLNLDEEVKIKVQNVKIPELPKLPRTGW